MNFIINVCLALLFLATSLNAHHYFDFQFRVGAYHHTSHQAKRAFEGSIPVYQVESSFFFMNPWEWIPWKAWANLSYMEGSGFADHLGDTDSNLTTFSLGLKHSWILDCYGGTVYLGAGPTLSWLRIKTHKIIPEGFFHGKFHGHRKIAKKNFGAMLKSGFQILLCNYVLFDVFADYFITAFHYKNFSKKNLFPRVKAVNKIHKFTRKDGHHRLDLGGFIFGGAIGVPF